MSSGFSFRICVALLAGLFGLAWGTPAQAACLSASDGAEACDTSAPMEGCVWADGEPTALCFSHHASTEALTGEFPSSDSQPGQGGSGGKGSVVPSVQASDVAGSFNWFVLRPHRRHLYVGVWLE